eukprot:3507805-Amphidinium_carterae.1
MEGCMYRDECINKSFHFSLTCPQSASHSSLQHSLPTLLLEPEQLRTSHSQGVPDTANHT